MDNDTNNNNKDSPFIHIIIISTKAYNKTKLTVSFHLCVFRGGVRTITKLYSYRA